ncbi:glycosyltransferase family 39 protein [Ancylobacter sp.]|uniref:glycosyltransferase family 39 protein n=1 Tax=Ancylobacter sp. TaxID=1872567 RepID=UPI003D120680
MRRIAGNCSSTEPAGDARPITAGLGPYPLAQRGPASGLRDVPIISLERVDGTSKTEPGRGAAPVRRLFALVGGAEWATRSAIFGSAALLVDFLAFRILIFIGVGLAGAQLASFCLASLSNYALNVRWTTANALATGRHPAFERYARYLAVALLALSLRIGILACASRFANVPAPLSILLAMAGTALVTSVGTALFAFPPARTGLSGALQWRVAVIAAAGYAIVLRLLFLGVADLLPQEAYYWDYAQHLDIGYLDHPPMVAWLIWGGTHLFGDNEFGVRIAAWFGWGVTAFFSFRLAQQLFGRSAALVSVLLVATLPFFFATGLVMTPDAPLTACWAGALYFLQRALCGGERRAWLGVGICLGLGMLSKYTIVLLVPASVLFMLVEARARVWLRRPEPYLAAALALVIFLPVIVWNLENGFASFAFQSTRRIEGVVRFSLPELLLSLAALLTPTGLAAALIALWPRLRSAGPKPMSGEGRDRVSFVAIFTLVPLSVFIAFSLFHMARLNWTGPLWLAVLPALAAGIVSPASAFERRMRRAWGPTLAISLVVYGIGLSYLVAGLPGLGDVPRFPTVPVAWRDFGQQAAGIAGDVRHATGQEPLLIGLDAYNIASELAFYGKGDARGRGNSVGRAVLGQPGLMYGYWYPANTLRGRPAVLFAVARGQLENPMRAAHFRSTGEVMEHEVMKDGRLEGHFYTRTGVILP